VTLFVSIILGLGLLSGISAIIKAVCERRLITEDSAKEAFVIIHDKQHDTLNGGYTRVVTKPRTLQDLIDDTSTSTLELVKEAERKALLDYKEELNAQV
jgi:hypothetical protein